MNLRPRLRFRLRTQIVAIAVLSLALAYVGSYYRLSRRGIREAGPYGIPGFLYVPCEETVDAQGIRRHYWLVLFYSPVNWADRSFFGGESPVACFLRLSG